MEKIINLISRVIPLRVDNVDTDQIIPARFLKITKRIDLSQALFADWRNCKDGFRNKDFVLNDFKYQGKVLVAGENFGCGSSREHAAWAIYDYGFRAVVSTKFADIFKTNALNNSIIPIEVSQDFINNLYDCIEIDHTTKLEIDVQKLQVKNSATGETQNFKLSKYKQHCFLNGLDDIDYLKSINSEILDFEKQNRIN